MSLIRTTTASDDLYGSHLRREDGGTTDTGNDLVALRSIVVGMGGVVDG